MSRAYNDFSCGLLANFGDAKRYMDSARDGYQRPVGNNTRLILRSENEIALQLHSTDVVTIFDTGEVEFNSGGWRTVTTKDRMNWMPGFGVYSHYEGRHSRWCVGRSPWWCHDNIPTYIFEDGIRFDPNGKCSTGELLNAVLAKEARERARMKRLSHHAMSLSWKAVRRLRTGLLVMDCDGCEEGCVSHTIRHLQRRTLSGSLVRRAMEYWLRRRQQPTGDWKYWLGLHHNANDDLMIGGRNYLATAVEPYVRKAVYSYLRRVIA